MSAVNPTNTSGGVLIIIEEQKGTKRHKMDPIQHYQVPLAQGDMEQLKKITGQEFANRALAEAAAFTVECLPLVREIMRVLGEKDARVALEKVLSKGMINHG
jgi:predicted ATP-dependent Lon-type protease